MAATFDSPRAEDERLELWTAWSDYFATGEGRQLVAYIGPATSSEDAERQLVQRFGSLYSLAAETSAGVVRNSITNILFTESALEMASRPNAWVQLSASLYFNFS